MCVPITRPTLPPFPPPPPPLLSPPLRSIAFDRSLAEGSAQGTAPPRHGGAPQQGRGEPGEPGERGTKEKGTWKEPAF